MTHEVEDFQRDVIEKSREQPVLVDFWAEWCGPCRALGPVLEKLESEAGGQWTLAKLDVDRNREVAARYRIQGIPAVKLFSGGEVVGEFTGALPESQVARWLESHLPNADQAELAAAIALVEEGDVDAGRQRLETLVEERPELEAARVVLAQLVLFSDPARAQELVRGVTPSSDLLEVVNDTRTLGDLLARDPADLPDDPARADYAAALEALRAERYAEALERFIAVVGSNKRYEDEGARRACVALFSYLGREHPLTREYRPRFQSALY